MVTPPNVLHPMETVGSLINKLKDQFEQNEKPAVLVETIQQLLSLFEAGPAACHTASTDSLPQSANDTHLMEKLRVANPDLLQKHLFAQRDETVDIPTLAHQNYIPTAPAESQPLYKKVATIEKESLNDRLREEKIEIATALQGVPIRDLKKAIGVNDRFLFIQNLFRGDENMYERSLKTINGFSIYPEAQYWIQRELKVKLSWPDQSDTVKLFDQLVKRRFS